LITNFEQLTDELGRMGPASRNGYVAGVSSGAIQVKGLSTQARIGDLVQIEQSVGEEGLAEVVAISSDLAVLSPFDQRTSPAIGAVAKLVPELLLRPSRDWIGRVVNAFGDPLDGRVGERGRELNEFIENGLGPEGMARSVVVAATSDQSSLVKRRAAWTATSIAEFFRDQGRHVLLILDSITRFAEAHREVALMAGETPSLRAYPPSTSNMIAALTRRPHYSRSRHCGARAFPGD